MPSLVFLTRLLAWLHTKYPVLPPNSNFQTSSLDQKNAKFNTNTSRLKDKNNNNVQQHRVHKQGIAGVRHYPSQVESYYPPRSTVPIFNNIFQLGRIFIRFKNGIRILVSCKYSRQKPSHHTYAALDLAVSNMLSAGIIYPSKKSPFCSNIFLESNV